MAMHNVVDGNSRTEASKRTSVSVAIVVAAVLVAGVLVNINQLGRLRQKAAPEHKVFATWRGDLFASGLALRTVRGRHRAPLELRKVAPGSTLIIPKGGEYPPGEFMGLLTQWGLIKSVRQLNYDPEHFLSRVDVSKSVLGSTPDVKELPPGHRRFVIVGAKDKKKDKRAAKRRKPSGREFIVLKRGRDDVLLDTAMAEKEVRKLKP